MKITSKYTEIQLNQVNWMFLNFKNKSCYLYIVEKPTIIYFPKNMPNSGFSIISNQISQKALGRFWWNKVFFNPWKALFKTCHVSSFENCKKKLTPSRGVCAQWCQNQQRQTYVISECDGFPIKYIKIIQSFNFCLAVILNKFFWEKHNINIYL